MTLEASFTFSSSESPDGLLSLSISALFSASAAAAALASLSAFSASLIAACFWISFAVGNRSSIFSAMGLSSQGSASFPTMLGALQPWALIQIKPRFGVPLQLCLAPAACRIKPFGPDQACPRGEWNEREPKGRLRGGNNIDCSLGTAGES